jgi:hypothetical protein
MSNQIVISSGAKVRSLEGVLTGTAGIVNALGINVANGIPQLDSNAKILVSQLPNSVMEYKGTWNASTNTPTLANGTGNQGDVYLCNVAGTVNFGAGAITFAVGDQVIYSGSIWQKAGGSTGTVTSVALTETGDALTITGSPITTSGTINIGFAGTTGQYINGAGGLTTFPSLTGFVPYTGATANLDLGTFDLTTDIATLNQVKAVGSGGLSFNSNSGTQVALMGGGGGAGTTFYGGIIGTSASFASNGGSDTFAINHSSGSGISLNITKGGSGEGLYINKTSGSGNAATIIGTLNATTLVKSGGTSSQYLMADGSVSTGPDLSGYVTLATTQTITGLKSFDAALNLKVGAGAGGTGYIGLGSITDNTLVVYNTTSGTTYSQSLAFPTGAGNTYTFPNASGTIALTSNFANYVSLDGNQTIIGIKTFNNDTIFNGAVDVNNSINLNSGVFFRNNAVGSTLYTNFSILKSGSLETLTYLFTTANSSKLVFNDAANYTYTFPTINGTLALLEGTQTFTGAKTFSLATNNESGIRLKNGFGASATGYTGLGADADQLWISVTAATHIFNFPSTTGRTYTFPASTGTLVLGTGTTNYLPKFTASGTIGNSSIIDNGTITAYTNAFYVYQTAGTGAAFYMTGGGTDATISSVTSGGANQNLNLMGSTLSLWTGTLGGLAYTERMRVTPTGNVGIGTSSPSSFSGYTNLSLKASGASGVNLDFFNSGGTRQASIVLDSSVGFNLNANAAIPMVFATNDAERMRITSSGNVGIGTSSPDFPLTIASASSANTLKLLGRTDGGSNLSFTNQAGTSTYGSLEVGASYFFVSAYGSSPYGIYTGGSERMRIFASGNVRFSSQVYGNTVASPRTLYIASDGELGGISSIRESKTNIAELDSNWLMQLNPVSFNYRKKNEDGKYTDEYYDELFYGLIAEETELVNKEICTYNDDKLVGIEYSKLVPVLVKAIQELSAKVSALENKS